MLLVFIVTGCPLTVDVLDYEIDTLKALIASYDAKIALLESQNDSPGPVLHTSGRRVKVGKLRLNTDEEDPVDYFAHRLAEELA